MPNLPEFLKSKNVKFRQHGEHQHTTQNWISVDCPYCSPNSNRFRLGFEINTGRTNCWACGGKHKNDALKLICQITYHEAVEFWSKTTTVFIEKPPHVGELKLPNQVYTMLEAHKNYLRNRGFNPAKIENMWGVRGIGLGSYLKWRLFIPIHDKSGEVVSWTTRSINKNNPKRYISAKSNEESVSHKTLLYGEHLVRDTIVICEGPLDAWSIGPGAIATCGLSYSKSQLNAMIKYQNKIICFDSEPDAQRRANVLLHHLESFAGETINIVLETGSDPAEADKSEILELRKEFLE